LTADGVPGLGGKDLVVGGRCPADDEARKRALWAMESSSDTVLATDRLSELYRLKSEDAPLAAGLLAVTLSTSEPWIVLWFRAERLETVNWAGNPHKSMTPAPSGALTPRASFDMWAETVRGRSRLFTIPEVESAGRLRSAGI